MLQRTPELPGRRSCFLLGPRQTGKSTLVRSRLPEDGIWIVDLLEHEVALRYAKDPGQFGAEAEARIERGTKLIFVDEVQKVPALLDQVHLLIEKYGTRFVLSGSSARKLRRGGANLLAGRASLRYLHPLTLEEQGEYFDLERTLRLGSLPAVVTGTPEEAMDLLRAYTETYLREEVMAEALVRDLGGFGRFLDIAAAQSGELVNYSAIGRDASLSYKTVQAYFQILEDTLIGFRLEAWRKSPRARLVAHPRFLLFDTGVVNALNRRLTAPLDPSAFGRLFEQWVILESRRIIDYARDETRIFHWRTHQGVEVDLLFERHGELRLAVEIKSKTTRVVGADCRGLRSFVDAHPDVPAVMVSRVPEEFALGPVHVLPYRLFFERLPELLDRRSSP